MDWDEWNKLPPHGTIARHIMDGDEYTAYCDVWADGAPCAHSKTLDLKALGKRFGMDFKISHWSLVPLLRCTKCGSRQVSIRVSPGDAVRKSKGRRGDVG